MHNIAEFKECVSEVFPQFGINKSQQIMRLLYEISKRENIPPDKIILDIIKNSNKFSYVKKALIDRRYPRLSEDEKKKCYPMPALNIKERYAVDTKRKFSIYPKRIFIEKEVEGSETAEKFKQEFSKSDIKVISKYKDYLKDREFTFQDFNKRAEEFYIVKEDFSFFQECPCTGGAVSCNYQIMNLGLGCAYECSYCFLQSYTNSPGILIPANIDDYFKNFKSRKRRIGTGQFTDSLIFDDIINYSSKIVDFFRGYKDTIFEFKTKSNNIDNLLKVEPSENIQVSWSLNPQKIIDNAEFFTASLKERIAAAKQCSEYGYKVGFHFDPIIYYNNWQKDYKEVVDMIFDSIKKDSIGWISLGCLRMTLRQKQAIETRFPENKILNGEFIPGFDEKLRYSFSARKDIYKNMLKWIRAYSKNIWVYLCMEDKDMYDVIFS